MEEVSQLRGFRLKVGAAVGDHQLHVLFAAPVQLGPQVDNPVDFPRALVVEAEVRELVAQRRLGETNALSFLSFFLAFIHSLSWENIIFHGEIEKQMRNGVVSLTSVPTTQSAK